MFFLNDQVNGTDEDNALLDSVWLLCIYYSAKSAAQQKELRTTIEQSDDHMRFVTTTHYAKWGLICGYVLYE